MVAGLLGSWLRLGELREDAAAQRALQGLRGVVRERGAAHDEQLVGLPKFPVAT